MGIDGDHPNLHIIAPGGATSKGRPWASTSHSSTGPIYSVRRATTAGSGSPLASAMMSEAITLKSKRAASI
ncbi:hypothetical protein WBO78_26010 [Bosea sp. CCNWLW174]|uniref:hypothetical protein n=1 Tax=unclassified Bosea (in: a-proteobacteria) TaxID=2653178 RepID=UPI003014D4B4